MKNGVNKLFRSENAPFFDHFSSVSTSAFKHFFASNKEVFSLVFVCLKKSRKVTDGFPGQVVDDRWKNP